VADVNGDGYDDIAQGDSSHATLGATTGGEVRLWLGGRRGPRAEPIVITQDTPGIDGIDEPGDEFGGVIAAGDMDDDGFADMIVAAPRENAGAGRIVVVRGNRSGVALIGHSTFGQDSPDVPGAAAPDREFGSALTVMRLSADRRPDLAVAMGGADRPDNRIMVVEGGRGVFAPGETRTTTLDGIAKRIRAAPGGRIRLARTAGN
jgi:hypothetical protein